MAHQHVMAPAMDSTAAEAPTSACSMVRDCRVKLAGRLGVSEPELDELMGKDPSTRKRFIMERAGEAQILDL